MEHLKQTGSGIRRLGSGHEDADADADTQISAREGEGLREAWSKAEGGQEEHWTVMKTNVWAISFVKAQIK